MTGTSQQIISLTDFKRRQRERRSSINQSNHHHQNQQRQQQQQQKRKKQTPIKQAANKPPSPSPPPTTTPRLKNKQNNSNEITADAKVMRRISLIILHSSRHSQERGINNTQKRNKSMITNSQPASSCLRSLRVTRTASSHNDR